MQLNGRKIIWLSRGAGSLLTEGRTFLQQNSEMPKHKPVHKNINLDQNNHNNHNNHNNYNNYNNHNNHNKNNNPNNKRVSNSDDPSSPAYKKINVGSKLDSLAADVNNFTQEQFESFVSMPLEQQNLEPKTIIKYEKHSKLFAEFVAKGRQHDPVSINFILLTNF